MNSFTCNPSPLALLLGGNDLESSITIILLTVRVGGTLLRNFTPATRGALVSKGTSGNGIDNALVGQFAAANELFREAASIQGLRVGVDRVGNNLSFRRQQK